MSAPTPTQYCSTGLCPPTTSDESTTLTSTSAELNAPSPPLPSSSTFDSTTVLDPLLDASTFTAPRLEITQGWRVVIEFCDRVSNPLPRRKGGREEVQLVHRLPFLRSFFIPRADFLFLPRSSLPVPMAASSSVGSNRTLPHLPSASSRRHQLDSSQHSGDRRAVQSLVV